MDMAATGPSKPSQKVKGPQASTSAHRLNVKKIAPPLPARPSSSSHPSTRKNGTHATLPLKNIQGTKTRRTDSSKDGWDRDVVFVTRNTPLGALMGRCRSLIMVEGYTCIRLHALAAAIPHALLLLHALLDILPYPQGDKGMWYEIRTGSTECIEEVKLQAGKGKGKEIDEVMDAEEMEFGDIGGIEEEEPERISKLKACTLFSRGGANEKASIEIDLHIGPKRKQGPSTTKGPPTMKVSKRSRPGKKKREASKREAGSVAEDEEEEDGGEEEAMNFTMSMPNERVERDMSPEEEEEELENR